MYNSFEIASLQIRRLDNVIANTASLQIRLLDCVIADTASLQIRLQIHIRLLNCVIADTDTASLQIHQLLDSVIADTASELRDCRYGCRYIYHFMSKVKALGQTHTYNDRQTDRPKTIYPPDHLI
ncbi:hypothetical protein DPMN_151661 [Dreissena polymorpha]|uniref:Uncharacterized protein n=1 Tax=Dreissena polymorpha TaxID=45954 RepID=A0A9D4FJY7_DREPO|nr:hypothetical protein DPMN_151661 [Dreissena polymorpha]